jgi:hypothetical protein
MSPKKLMLAAVSIAAVGIPATAEASTVSLENGTLVVRAAPGETNGFNISHGWDPSRLRIGDYVRPSAYPSSCVADDEEGLGA